MNLVKRSIFVTGVLCFLLVAPAAPLGAQVSEISMGRWDVMKIPPSDIIGEEVPRCGEYFVSWVPSSVYVLFSIEFGGNPHGSSFSGQLIPTRLLQPRIDNTKTGGPMLEVVHSSDPWARPYVLWITRHDYEESPCLPPLIEARAVIPSPRVLPNVARGILF